MAACAAAWPGVAAWALSLDSRSQLHAVIGQPLALTVPVSFAGVNPNAVVVRVTPGPDLALEEEVVAASVQASYDASLSAVRLTTARRITVPALSLHLVVTSGGLVVNQDIDVLVDIPDLNTQHTARADTPAPAAAPPPAGDATTAPAIRVLDIAKPQAPPTRQFGAPVATPVEEANTAGGERPSVTPPPPPPPPDPRPRSYVTRSGDTLSVIARRLAEPWKVAPEPMSLALYEANSKAFDPKDPERAVAGQRLQVPDDLVVRSEPAARVAEFRAWLRQPLEPWQPRSYQSYPLAPPPLIDARQQLQLAQALGVVIGVAVLGLFAVLLLRRLRLRQLMTRYVPMSAVDMKKVRRIIIPTPPPRRGLSQGAVTEKLRIKRLREVLDHNPFRSDIRYRLAERLHKAGDGRTFAQIAPPLRPSLSPEGWERICKMGRELLPDDPRFQQ